AKGIVGSDYKYIIPSSLVLGAVLLVYTDILSRMINPPYETPVVMDNTIPNTSTTILTNINK
ncbi:hypothetical protein EWM17_19655, partial [Clostridioides difficile]|uniref:iron chelate uptake ABC transporter family permease subunit n=1 Tax=Clostridioides difficile TaxID=1496 RepID=UPI00115E447D